MNWSDLQKCDTLTNTHDATEENTSFLQWILNDRRQGGQIMTQEITLNHMTENKGRVSDWDSRKKIYDSVGL